MSTRRVRVVLLCEDSQQEAFARRFLKGMGWNVRELRVEKSPSARGAAEQWVKEQFVLELKVYRGRRQRAASAIIVMIDADIHDVQFRINELRTICEQEQIAYCSADEDVAIAVPRRNIETWIHYLNGQDVNETDEYPKLDRERSCQAAVNNLLQLCRSTGLNPDAPNSLSAACAEYRTRIHPLMT